MANNNTKKKEVSDLTEYDLLIAEQKKRVRQRPDDVKEWLELGRLHEARIDLIKYSARFSFSTRYFIPLFFLSISAGIVVSIRQIYSFASSLWQSIWLTSPLITALMALSSWMWYSRYPPSGRKYFRRAIALDPGCGEAYMYLGLISLRRYQKRKACRLLEQAIRLKVNHGRIEQELKSIYGKEFMAFFKAKTDREVRQQEIIDSQLGQIRKFRSEISSLERLAKSLRGRVDQARWEGSHKAKLLAKEMTNRIAAIRKEYEKEIADMKRAKESQQEAKESAERNFVRLTTEVMEARAAVEGRSLDEAARALKDIMGSRTWKAFSEETRCYLATAEHIFRLLTEGEENPDYSLVGMELCKALETEINRTLVEPFLEFINGNREEFLRINQKGEIKGNPLYVTYLAKFVDREHFPEVTSLTLGQYHFLLKRTLDSDYALREYGDFLNELCSNSEVIVGKTFLKKLETVTKKYRNTITHRSPMNRKQCHHLRELIFAEDGALLKICSAFNVQARELVKIIQQAHDQESPLPA